jgi:hypothetical protein
MIVAAPLDKADTNRRSDPPRGGRSVCRAKSAANKANAAALPGNTQGRSPIQAEGNVKEKVLPSPTWLSAQILPSWASTSRFEM